MRGIRFRQKGIRRSCIYDVFCYVEKSANIFEEKQRN